MIGVSGTENLIAFDPDILLDGKAAKQMALTSTSLPNLTLIAKGKVRDIYSLPSTSNALLFVATDRVSLSIYFH